MVDWLTCTQKASSQTVLLHLDLDLTAVLKYIRNFILTLMVQMLGQNRRHSDDSNMNTPSLNREGFFFAEN